MKQPNPLIAVFNDFRKQIVDEVKLLATTIYVDNSYEIRLKIGKNTMTRMKEIMRERNLKDPIELLRESLSFYDWFVRETKNQRQFASSTDGGRTWIPLQVFPDNPQHPSAPSS